MSDAVVLSVGNHVARERQRVSIRVGVSFVSIILAQPH